MFLTAYRWWERLQGKMFTVLSRPAFFGIGKRTTVQTPIRLSGERHIEIGTHVFVGPNSWLEVIPQSLHMTAPVITIGDRTSISGFCTISAVENVVIESDVLIARYVYIADHLHAHESREEPVKAQGITRIAPVKICSGAWLGQSVVICPGVTIGRNAVIGANSVVRQDVPDFCVAAGVPAKIIRRVDEAAANNPTPC